MKHRAAEPTVICTDVPTLADGLIWLGAVHEDLNAIVAERGAVVVRGLPLASAADLAAVRDVLTSRPSASREPFAARTHLGNGVYTPTEWPEDKPICLHPEQSYRLEFPRLLLFGCLVPPHSGGATLLGDNRQILAALPDRLVDRFRTHGWQLVRNYRAHVGPSWRETFRTDDIHGVEDYCQRAGVDLYQLADGGLRTTQRRPAITRHPATGEECWFNQVAFLNRWSLAPVEHEVLISAFGVDGLPFDTLVGDGSPLDSTTVDMINGVHEACTVRVRWNTGDVLIVDNVLTSHGREAYRGPREIVIAMGAPVIR